MHYDVEMVEDDAKLGSCSCDSLLIRVDPRIKPEKQQYVFIHELMHALFHEAGIYLDEEVEEDYVNRLSRVLFQVLKDNQLNFEE